MAFQGKSKRLQQQFSSPEELYLKGGLARTPQSVDSLWLHQGDVIRAYAENHLTTSDLALELPTGSGKTLPGLLIGEWVRRKDEGPVLYVTPTKQLADQVLSTAHREGIPGVLMTGSHHSWSPVDASAMESGEAIGVTTYSSVFNTSPKLPEPRLLIFDDAHAAAEFVGEEYGISIRRTDLQAYLRVLNTLKPFMSDLQVQRLMGEPDPGAHHQVRLILPAIDDQVLARLDKTLNELEEYKFKLAMIRSGLPSCCVYLAYGGIQIRPMVPPTYENRVYSRASQRIYLSATLGSGGELERAFGCSCIVRMPLPTKTPPRSGRRLFVFPDVTSESDSIGLTRRLIGLNNKALVLSQDSSAKTEEAAASLAGAGVPVFGREVLEQGLETFANSGSGVLGLANRYDGLDLPGGACRIVVLSGKPDVVSLQDKFLSERAEASVALVERLRTRIVQGTGRCTRGPNDYAVVVVLGSDITRYFSNRVSRKALDPELQAEVEFGWQNSRGADSDDVIENVQAFLDQDTDWREQGEPKVGEFRQDTVKAESPAADALGKSAGVEVEAWQLAFRGDWVGASAKLQEAAQFVGTGGDSTRGYRGLLLYLAAVWLHLGAQDEAQRARVRDLVRESAAASNRGTWLKEMSELPGIEQTQLAAMDVVAVNKIAALLRGRPKVGPVKDRLASMQEALAQTAANKYEAALTTMGTYLGAEAAKPKGPGRCDSAWVWGTEAWVTVEAKSEQHPDALLPLKDIRQVNTQLDQLASDRGVDHPPAGSVSILVSDRLTVDPAHTQVANPNVYLTSTETIAQIAGDLLVVWNGFLTSARGVVGERPLRAHVQSVMTEHGCLPSQVIDRLTQQQIRSGDE